MKKLELILVLVLFVFVCIFNFCSNGPTKEKLINVSNDVQIENVCDDVWKNLKIKVENQVLVNQNELYIKLKFVSDYYITTYTNELLVDYLIYKQDSLIYEYDKITIEYSYYDLVDVHTITYKKDFIKQLQNDFNTNKLFVELVPVIIQNTNTVEIIGINEMLVNLRNYYSKEEYSFEGDFWKFTYLYTMNCCDTNSVVHDNMSIAKYAAEYPEYQNRPDIFQKIIDEGEKYCKSLDE